MKAGLAMIGMNPRKKKGKKGDETVKKAALIGTGLAILKGVASTGAGLATKAIASKAGMGLMALNPKMRARTRRPLPLKVAKARQAAVRKAMAANRYKRTRIASPKEFDPRSFRTITPGSGRHKMVIACPKGQYKGGKCKVGMEVQSVMKRVGKNAPKKYHQARAMHASTAADVAEMGRDKYSTGYYRGMAKAHQVSARYRSKPARNPLLMVVPNPSKSLTLYARREPTTDPLLVGTILRYPYHYDVVLYKDEKARSFYGRYAWDHDKPTRNTKTVNMAGVRYSVIWLGDIKASHVNPGGPGGIKVLAGPFKDRKEAARERDVQVQMGHKGLIKVISIPDAGVWYVVCQRSKRERTSKNPLLSFPPRGPGSYARAGMSDEDLLRLHHKLHKRIFEGGGTMFGADVRTLKMTRPGLYHEIVDIEREIKRRGMALAKANPGVHKSPPFRIQYLPANQVWVMTWGDQIIDIRGKRSFPSKAAAIAAAKAADIKVDLKTGICTNPPRSWHLARVKEYGKLYAGDEKAGHGEAKKYWEGALAAEARAVASEENASAIHKTLAQAAAYVKNPGSRELIAKAVIKFYQAQTYGVKRAMEKMDANQLVMFVRKHAGK